MTAEKVIELLRFLEQHQVQVVVDGGWGVDALLGKQTRKHADLDIAIPHTLVPKLRALLEPCGYKEIPRDDTWECNFVLAHDDGRTLDVHSYLLDDSGENIFGVAYQAHHLTGTGTINGYPVRCVPPEVAVSFHLGYELDRNDYHDVALLCEKFKIALPLEYEQFTMSRDDQL
jgi:lincosamide nucleotidyltransferase A/C/D/E